MASSEKYFALQDDEKQIPSPEATANIFSRISFWWAHTLLARGYQKPLEPEDLYSLPNVLRAENVDEIPIDWSKKWPLARAILKYYFKHFWWITLLEFSSTIPMCLAPFLVQALIFTVQSGTVSISGHPIFTNAWQIVAALFVCRFAFSCITQQNYWQGFKAGLRLQTSVMSMAYKKGLRMSTTGKSVSGTITNIMAVDAENILILAWSALVFSITIPLQLIALVSLACFVVGPVGLLGFFSLVLAGIIQMPLAKKEQQYAAKSREKSDSRVKLLTEVLQGIRVIKYYNWEPAFKDRVQKIRDEQLTFTLQGRKINIWSFVVSTGVSGVALAVTFSTYVFTGHTLTPEY